MAERIGPFRDSSTMLMRPPESGAPSSRGRSTAIEGKGSFTIAWDGMNPQDLRRWEENTNPYENLAGDDEVASRALNLVAATINHYDSNTQDLRAKWSEMDTLLQGKSIRWGAWNDADAVHSPRLYQQLETLEARITDAILNTASGDGEWFAARGREQSDIEVEAAIQGWVAWNLDRNDFDERISEIVRTMLIYGFVVVKTGWENVVDWRVRRERETVPSPRGRLFKTDRIEEKKLLDSGTTLELVDPRWFFCDTRFVNPKKMAWIGDRCRMSYDEIADLGEQGKLDRWQELEGQEPIDLPGLYGSMGYEGGRQREQDRYFQAHHWGGSKTFYVDRWWGRFDPFGKGRTREFSIWIANGTTPILVKENEHDDKHRPYAIGRACKYPFDFHSVGPLDHCIPLQIEVDTHRQLALDGSRLSVCPLVFADSRENLGESLFGVQPGTVFEVPPDSVKFTDIESPVRNMLQMESILVNDIERTAGAPGFYMGANAEGTNSATEYQGRTREANMRIRSYIRSVAECLRQVMHQICSLSGQYMMSERAVRVLGEKASWLGQRMKVAPNMFDSPVDFEFVVLGNLHVTGMEATNMQLFLNSVLPFAPPGQVNLARLTERSGRMLLGSRAQGIVADVDDFRSLMSQDDELLMMLDRQPVKVHSGDSDAEHLDWIEGFKMSPMWDAIDDDVRALIDEHEAAHRQQIGQKRRQKMALLSYQAPFPVAAEAGYPGQGSSTNMMRQNERALTGGGGPSGTPVGETPGPGRTDQLSSAGRSQPITQSANEGFSMAG